MAITNGYTTRDDLRYRLDPSGSITWSDGDSAAHDAIIEAASRWIDGYQRKRGVERFFVVSETRYYTAQCANNVSIDNCVSVASLAVDSSGDRTYSETWESTDYDLLPFNASTRGEPFNEIEAAQNGRYSFPSTRRSVKVTGSFGYCALSDVPAQIKEACLLLSMRLWKRKDAIFGVAGVPALGVQVVQAKISADADITTLLDSIPMRLD